MSYTIGVSILSLPIRNSILDRLNSSGTQMVCKKSGPRNRVTKWQSWTQVWQRRTNTGSFVRMQWSEKKYSKWWFEGAQSALTLIIFFSKGVLDISTLTPQPLKSDKVEHLQFDSSTIKIRQSSKFDLSVDLKPRRRGRNSGSPWHLLILRTRPAIWHLNRWNRTKLKFGPFCWPLTLIKGSDVGVTMKTFDRLA